MLKTQHQQKQDARQYASQHLKTPEPSRPQKPAPSFFSSGYGVAFIIGVVFLFLGMPLALLGVVLIILTLLFYSNRDTTPAQPRPQRVRATDTSWSPQPVQPLVQREEISTGVVLRPIPVWDLDDTIDNGVLIPLNNLTLSLDDLQTAQSRLIKRIAHFESKAKEYLDPEVEITQDDITELTRLQENIKAWKKEIARMRVYHGKITTQIERFDLPKYVEVQEAKIAELNELMPDFKQQLEDFPEDSFYEHQSKLDELIQTNTSSINRITEELYPAPKIEEPPLVTVKEQPLATVKVHPIATVKPEPEKTPVAREYRTTSLRLKSLVGILDREKLISNLFAYAGAIFIIGGLIGISVFVYSQYGPSDPGETTKAEAKSTIITMYVLASVLNGVGIVLRYSLIRKFSAKFNGVFNLVSSIGYLIFATALYLQVYVYDNTPTNLEWDGLNYLIPGLLVLTIGFIQTYFSKSQAIATTQSLFALYLGFTLFAEYQDKSLLVDTDARDVVFTAEGARLVAFLYYGSVLLITTAILVKRKFWIQYVIYCLATPVLWLIEDKYIGAPSILLLLISISMITAIVKQKMLTSKPFTHFLGTVFLIYPNLFAIVIDLVDIKHTASWFQNGWKLTEVTVVYSVFFALYWIFVISEKEIELSFSMPVSFSFDQEELKTRPYYQKLNWLMLASNVILIFVALTLIANDVYEPIIVFAILMNLTTLIGFKYKLESLVPSSLLSMMVTGEFFFILLYDSTKFEEISQILIAIFLITQPVLFEFFRRTLETVHLWKTKLPSESTVTFIALFSLINFVISGYGKNGGAFILLGTLCWIGLAAETVRERSGRFEQVYAYLALGTAILIPFFEGIVRTDWESENKFTRDFGINISILLFPLFALFTVLNSDKLLAKSKTDLSEYPTLSESRIMQAVDYNFLHLPQLSIFMLPGVIFAFGVDYFFIETNRQLFLILHLIIFFVSIPILYWLSQRSKNRPYWTLASFLSYFAFIMGFAFLGGAKWMYNRLVNPGGEKVKAAKPIISIDLAMSLFTFIAIVTILITIFLSNKPLYNMNSASESQEKIDQTNQKSEEVIKEENGS
jgi:hypothetical protein